MMINLSTEKQIRFTNYLKLSNMELDKNALEKQIEESAKRMAQEIYEYGEYNTYPVEHIDEESGWEIRCDISCELSISTCGDGYWEPMETVVKVKHLRIYEFSILHYDEDTDEETPIEGDELKEYEKYYEDYLCDELCA